MSEVFFLHSLHPPWQYVDAEVAVVPFLIPDFTDQIGTD